MPYGTTPEQRFLEKFFKKNFRDDHLFLGFAKVLALALILTPITISESQAIEIPTGGASGTCNSAGTCLWNLDESGKMTISAATGAKDVRMDNYFCQLDYCRGGGGNRPWENYLQDIKNVVVGDNITYIGNDAFQSAHNLETVTGMKDVTTIGSNGVFAYTGLTSITIPEGVTSIGWNIFGAAKSLTSITIPDNIDTENWAANLFQSFPKGTDIVCQGDLNTCYEKLAKYIPTDKGGTCTEYCIKKDILPALFDSCKSTNYFWDGSTCIREPDVMKRKCCTSCKDMGGWCKRIRYTPAEAAKVLKDDNTNEVTITFKK